MKKEPIDTPANTPVADNTSEVEHLEAQLASALEKIEQQKQVLEQQNEKIVALEAALNAPVDVPEAAVKSKPATAALTGEAFGYNGERYRLKYPTIYLDGKQYSEADVLADKPLQARIVSEGYGVVEKLAMLMLFVLFSFGVQASTVAININTAEVVATSFKTREFYPLGELLIIYRVSNEAFEIQNAATRSKIWGGDIDSVSITGLTTAAQKLAYLGNLMLTANTTNGYKVYMGRSNLEYSYSLSNNRLNVNYGRNKQPLWFGHIDSLKVGALSGASAKLTYLRSLHKWRSQDVLPFAAAPTIAAGAAAGGSPTVSVTGDAFSGTITVTPGSSPTTGTLATITLNITAPTGTRVVVSPTGDNSTLHYTRVKYVGTATTIVLSVPASALTTAVPYTWDYETTPY